MTRNPVWLTLREKVKDQEQELGTKGDFSLARNISETIADVR